MAGWCVVFRLPGGVAVAAVGLRVDVGRLWVVVLVVVVVVVDCGGDGDGGDGGFVDDRVRVVAALSPLVFLTFLAATKSGSNTKRIVGLSWKAVSFHAAVALVRPSASCRSLLTHRIVSPRTAILSLRASTSIDVRFSERLRPGDNERSTAS